MNNSNLPSKPFTTDGCSGGMSWFWKTFLRRPPPWEGHCVEHDKSYWAGGTAEERKRADLILASSVTRQGYPIIAALMYYGVRIGGHPRLPFPWRWGYGYEYYQPYR